VGDRLRICTVVGFPTGYQCAEAKALEAKEAIREGADEIDTVINIGDLKAGRTEEIARELSLLRAATEGKILKVIVEICLLTKEELKLACELVNRSGADFIKTSTGKVPVNATPEATYVMCQAIKAWKEKTGEKVCYKPAGGVSTTAEAVQHYTLVKEILGEDWLNNESFRFGASRLANNLLTSITGNEVKYF
jgi:deoxyribose-phosphate aldolase